MMSSLAPYIGGCTPEPWLAPMSPLRGFAPLALFGTRFALL